MPIVRGNLTDGGYIDFYVPVGVKEDQLPIYGSAALKKQARGEDPTKPPETTIGGALAEIPRGLASGAAGLLESAATGAAFLLPEELEQQAREKIAEIGAGVQADLAPRAGYEDTITRKGSEALGSTAPFLATAPFGLAGLAAGVAVGGAAGAGEAAKRAEAAGATEDQISQAAGLGILPGLGETLVPFAIGKTVKAMRVAKGLKDVLGEEVAQTTLMRLRRVAQAAGGEGLQEASTEVAQNLISQGVYDPETGTFAGTGESLGYGAGVGGLLAALAELAIPGRPRANASAQRDLARIQDIEKEQAGQMDLFPAEQVEAEREFQGPVDTRAPAPLDEETGPVSDLSQYDLFDTRRGQKPISPRDLPVVAEPRIVGTPEGELILPGQEAEARQRAIEEREKAVAERRQAVEAEGAIESLPAGQREMFPDTRTPILSKEDMQNAGVSLRIPAVTRAIGKDLSDPKVRESVISDLTSFTQNKNASKANREAVARLLNTNPLLKAIEAGEGRVPATETSPGQIDIEQQIDADVLATQEQEAEAARTAAFDQIQQERAQQEIDAEAARTAAFEEAEAAREDQIAGQEVLARSEQELAAQPTATALAMQQAQQVQQRTDERGRVIPGEQQLGISAIPTADPTIQELRGVEERIAATEQAQQQPTPDQQEAEELLTEQGELIGPKGGPRTRIPPRPTTVKSTNIAGDIKKINRLKKRDPMYINFFKDKSPFKAIMQLGKKINAEGLTKANETAYRWVQENLSPVSNRRLGWAIAKHRELQGLPLPIDAMVEVGVPVSPEVSAALNNGSLQRALERLLVGADKDVARVVRAVLKGIGTTSVRFEGGIVNRKGEPIAGVFRPRTNEIVLNPDVELTTHTFLHETLHAVTSHEIARNTPAAIQMRNLFESVRGRLDTAYGATSLDEFVAEVFSNPELQAKLARINEKGEKIGLLQKFNNIISNIIARFRGVPTKKVESARNAVDKLLDSLISPAPEYRDAADLYSATLTEMSDTVLNSLGRFSRGTVSETDIATVSGFLRGAGRAIRRFAYSFLPLNAIVNVSKLDFPGISKDAGILFKLIQEKNGARSAEMSKVKDTAREISDLFKGKSEQLRKVFNFVVAESTLLKVDPTKPRSDYAADPVKQNEWDVLNAKIRELSPSEQQAFKKAYTDLRDSYRKVYDDLIETLETRLNNIEMEEGARRTIKDKLLQQLTKDSIEPYFPLYRKGTHWLTYRSVDPRTGNKEFYKELFESEAQRSKARAMLPEDATNISTFERNKNGGITNFGAVDAQWAYGIFQDLQAAGVDQNAQDIVLQALLDAMPERSALNAFRKRKNVLGFQLDALKVFRERMPNFVQQKVNLQYDLPFSQISADIKKSADEYISTDKQNHANDLAQLLQEYITFARNPQLATWSRALKSAGFGMTLGLNVSSVVVNATNLPIVVLPYLGGKFGFRKSAKAMEDARKIYMSTGMRRTRKDFLDREGGTEVDGPNLSNLDFNNPDSLPKGAEDLGPLMELLEIRGQSNASTIADALDYDNPSNGWWTKTNAIMGYMFHQGERANRQITAIASYKLELDAMAKKKKVPVSELTEQDRDMAAELALETTELTNSGAMTETGPRIAQSNWGSWLMMYKRFGISILYLQAKMGRQVLKGVKDKGERAEAVRQISGLFAMSGLFAGVQGLPLYGIISMIADTVFLDDEDENFDSIAASFFGEGFYSGALNSIFGVDVAPRIGMTNLVYRTLPNREQDSMILQAMETVGGPVFGIVSRMEDGVSLIGEGEILRGLEKMLPSAISNGMRGARFGIEGATTLRGDPVVEDLNAWNVLAQTLGFAPASYMQMIEMNAKDKRIDREISESKRKLLRQFHLARRVGDTDEMRELVKEFQGFNKRHPEVAITPETFIRSMNSHSLTDEIARQFSGITINRRRIPTVLRQRLEDIT